MLLRLTAALMFVSAGGMIGMHFSYKLKLKREVCREIEYLLRCCEIYIRCNAMNVYEITGHLRRDPELSHLDFISRLPEEFSEGINFHDEWRRALASQEMPQEERQILAEQVKNDPKMAGKPEKVVKGAVEGRLAKELKDFCLLD